MLAVTAKVRDFKGQTGSSEPGLLAFFVSEILQKDTTDHAAQIPRARAPGDVAFCSPTGRQRKCHLPFSASAAHSRFYLAGVPCVMEHPLDVRGGKDGLPVKRHDCVARLQASSGRG